MKGIVIALIPFVAALGGCWDDPAHELDTDGVAPPGDSAGDADTDTDSDADAAVAPGGGQGDLPPGWEGFGTACVDDSDCSGYGTAANRRCLTNVLGYVSAPGGFCTACCDHVAKNGCAPNVDCVGVDDTYVICVSRCNQLSDCRESEGWECRHLWYSDTDIFPDLYCMPDPNHVVPDTDQPFDDPQCPWPWLDSDDEARGE